MENLLIAILMALKVLFPPDASTSMAEYEAKRHEVAQYVLDNNLFREKDDGGVIIDSEVSL